MMEMVLDNFSFSQMMLFQRYFPMLSMFGALNIYFLCVSGARLHLSVCSGAGDRVAGCRKRQSSDQQRSQIFT